MLSIYSLTRSTTKKSSLFIQKRYYERVSAVDAIKAQKINKGIFLDLRPPEVAKEVSPVGFTNIPHYSLETKIATLNKLDTIYLLDNFGYYSEKAGKLLDSHMFNDVRVVEGGMLYWAFKGGSLTSENPEHQPNFSEQAYPLNYSTAQAIVEKEQLQVKEEDLKFPLAHLFFDSKKEQEEALAKSPRKKK